MTRHSDRPTGLARFPSWVMKGLDDDRVGSPQELLGQLNAAQPATWREFEKIVVNYLSKAKPAGVTHTTPPDAEDARR